MPIFKTQRETPFLANNLKPNDFPINSGFGMGVLLGGEAWEQ